MQFYRRDRIKTFDAYYNYLNLFPDYYIIDNNPKHLHYYPSFQTPLSSFRLKREKGVLKKQYPEIYEIIDSC